MNCNAFPGAVGCPRLARMGEDVPHQLHDEISEENGQYPFEPLGQAVYHDGVSRQYPKQVPESFALNRMVGREQRDQRSGDIADEVAKGSADTELLELVKTEGAPNKFAHGLAPRWPATSQG